MLAQQQGRAGRIQQGSHYIPAPAHSNLANPDRLTYSVEPARIPRSLEIAREYGVVLDEEATPFDPELAEIKLFEIQSDGDPRHHNGAVDAQDIADAYGVDVKRVRRMADDVIFALTSQGKLHGSSGAKRKRPGGTQSKHYSQQVRDILLTRVKEEALSQSGETN